jgi:hypothetical protein
MNRKTLLPLLISLNLVACADPHGESTAGGAGGAASASASSAATTATSGATTGTGTPGEQTVTIAMDSFEIPAGAEVYKCQNFANPFGGDVDVSAFESHMTGGSHHLLLFYEDGATDGAIEDCSGLEFAPTPYSTQLPDDMVAFPAGVAAAIPKAKGLRLQSHYLNTTAGAITAHVEMTFHLAAPGTVTDHAGVLFVVQPFISVPPNSTKDINYNCNIPLDMAVIKTASHMHKHGTHFVSTVAGQPFYETDTWDEPQPALFDPPRKLHAGDPLDFTCTFVNTSPDTLTFGESAASNEMCILVASFYPAPAGQPTIGCN